MKIFFHGHGTIRLKKETANEFADKFQGLLGNYGSQHNFMCNDDGLLQFKNYANHFFIVDCIQLIKDNIDLIEDGRLWFKCNDEDESYKNPLPFVLMLEIKEGQVYTESLYTRLRYDWDSRYVYEEWFDTVINKEFEEQVNN